MQPWRSTAESGASLPPLVLSRLLALEAYILTSSWCAEAAEQLLPVERSGRLSDRARSAGRGDRRRLHRAAERPGARGRRGRRAAPVRRGHHRRTPLADAWRRLLLLRVPPAHEQSPHRRRLARQGSPPGAAVLDPCLHRTLSRSHAPLWWR